MPEAGGSKPVCEFCGGLRDAPSVPNVLQYPIRGQQRWLHLQCRVKYEQFTEPYVSHS